MPYITKKRGLAIRESGSAGCKGELNYVISCLIADYVQRLGVNYQVISDAIDAAHNAADEATRRILQPYETYKMLSNLNEDPYLDLLKNEFSTYRDQENAKP